MSARNENISNAQAIRGSRRALKDVSNRTAKNGSKVAAKATNAAVQKRAVRPTTKTNSGINREIAKTKKSSKSSESSTTTSKSPDDATDTASNKVSTTVAYQYSAPPHDIDEVDVEDPLCVVTYIQDIYEHFRANEHNTCVSTDYMADQPYITATHRSILVDWLVDVHLKFKMVPETLYLTVNLVDRYLTKIDVLKSKLQLVGIGALLIASKYEEYQPPSLKELVYICDKAYTKLDILDMEQAMLKKLDYKITVPSAHAFLVRFLKAAHADKKIVQLSCYILDGALQSYNLIGYLPSQLAAAAVFIARKNSDRNGWSPTLLKYTEYVEEEIIPIARKLLRAKILASSKLRAVDDKYKSRKFGRVAYIELDLDF